MNITIYAPLYEKEFGHGLTLHDAEVRAVERIEVDGTSSMLWSLKLFEAPIRDLATEKAYRYTLAFVDPSGLDVDPVGADIYRFATETVENRLKIQMVLLPEGKEIVFECRRVVEVDLTPAP